MAPATYTFQDVCVDTRKMVVERAGVQVPLEPKALDVLLFLIEHRDRLVTKEELLDHVWKDTFVTPNVLTRIVAQLRKAMGDDARESQIIETFSKRGYRFIAPLAEDAVVDTAPLDRPVPSTTAAPEVVAVAPVAAPASPNRRGLIPGLALALVVIAGVFAWSYFRHAPAPRPEPAAPRRLTTRGGYNGNPSISRDGRSMAYVSDRAGSREIYVSGLASGSAEVAITNNGGQNVQPSWSPDGQWIAFHSEKTGGVWIVSSGGGVPRQVVEFGSNPTWSPDGQRLAFTSDAGGMASQSTIWTVSASGADRRELTKNGQPAGGHRAPTWSHSGRFIVFNLHDGANRGDFWAVDVATGAFHEILQASWSERASFSNDDRSLYVAARVEGSSKQIWRLPIDPETVRLSGKPELVLSDRGGDIDGLSIAIDGTAVFGVASDDNNIWAVATRPDGFVSEPVRVTDDAVRNSQPAFAADGRLAYQQLVIGRPVSTWILSADGTRHEPLLPGAQAAEPAWGRDGTRMLVRSDGQLAWINLASRQATPVPGDLSQVQSWRLSPDERTIAFHKVLPDGQMNIWTRPLGGGPDVQITHDREAAGYPAWSPDGRWIAVEVKRLDHTHIGVVPSDGSRPIELLTSSPGQAWPRSWAPDSDRIVFAGQRDGVWNIFSVSRTTKITRQLTHFTSRTGFVRYPDWSPDGTRIAFERSVRVASVWATQIK